MMHLLLSYSSFFFSILYCFLNSLVFIFFLFYVLFRRNVCRRFLLQKKTKTKRLYRKNCENFIPVCSVIIAIKNIYIYIFFAYIFICVTYVFSINVDKVVRGNKRRKEKKGKKLRGDGWEDD